VRARRVRPPAAHRIDHKVASDLTSDHEWENAVAKSRNNLLGVGGQRKKLSRTGQQGAGPVQADRKAAADQKQELLRRMRERAQSGPAASDEPAPDDSAQPGTAGQDAPAQS